MGILKTKPLTELLSQTISASVTSALLFTPSGALLATDSAPTSSPSSTSRTHAALAATIWASYIPSAPSNLTLELSGNNVHIQGVCDGKVLLCLIGPKELSGGGSGLGVLKMQAVALGGYLERELDGWDVPEGL